MSSSFSWWLPDHSPFQWREQQDSDCIFSSDPGVKTIFQDLANLNMRHLNVGGFFPLLPLYLIIIFLFGGVCC